LPPSIGTEAPWIFSFSSTPPGCSWTPFECNLINELAVLWDSRSPDRQKELMEDKKTQKVFEQVKDDSSSLYTLCDSVSFVTKRTKTTTATSKLSMNFAFDAELLQNGAYKRAFRSLMRRVGARQSRDDGDSNRPMATRSPNPSQVETEQANRSTAIDRELEKDSHRLRREIQILAIGKDAPTLMKQMQVIHKNGYTQEHRIQSRLVINQYLLSTLRDAMGMAAVTEAGSTVSIEFEGHKRILDSIPNDAKLIDGFNPEVRETLCWCAKYSRTRYKLEDTQS
jgi:hypothetical protein